MSFVYSIIIGLGISLILLLSGWIAAIIGRGSRYLYFIAGIVVGIFDHDAVNKWPLIALSVLVSFFMYMKSDDRIKRGQASSHVPNTITLSMSGYLFGVVIGLVIYFIQFIF